MACTPACYANYQQSSYYKSVDGPVCVLLRCSRAAAAQLQDGLGDRERRAAAALAVQRLMGALGVEDSDEEEEAGNDGSDSDAGNRPALEPSALRN